MPPSLMSYGLMAYAVDMSRVRAALGSRDEATFEAYSESLDTSKIDEVIEDLLGGQPGPTARELLHHMIFGEPYDTRLGSAYAYVFEHVCDRNGRFLDNGAWTSIRVSFFAQVGRALERAGVPASIFSVDRLISGAAPVPLGQLGDFPGIGWLSEDEVAPISAALAKADLTAISDSDERRAVQALRAWTEFCAQRHAALVCFYY